MVLAGRLKAETVTALFITLFWCGVP